ncbi:deoxyribose-phosphate aldolase [Haemophilus parahaemolyticus]|uniref:deoxyribose-phosphate aldolase n=1 Tax=Haemophilus parahaemolyticus TaxID=735 RepID=UPI00352D85E4
MKKLSLAVLVSMVLAACTADVYSTKGDATILSSKDISKDVVELTVQKDNGEIVTLKRKYDSHATVGARVTVADQDNKQDADLNTIRRYEFK